MTKLDDTIVIYRSEEDECWVAHSLRTDQLGVGPRIVDALADAIKAVGQVAEVAASDPTIALFREAPPRIQEMARRARPMPTEIYEIALKMARGQWPEYLEPDITPHGTDELFEIQVNDELGVVGESTPLR